MNRKERRAREKAKERTTSAQVKQAAAAAGGPEALRRQADVLSRAGQYANAARLYRQSLALEPDHVLAYGSLAFVLLRVGKRDEAVECYRKALEIHPDHLAIMHDLGTLLVSMRRYEDAEHYLKAVVARQPMLAEAHFNLGQLYAAMGRSKDAAHHFKQSFLANKELLARQPRNPDILLLMGRALMRIENFLDAVEWLRSALAVDPNHASANYHLGRAFEQLGQYERAEHHMHQAVTLNPRLSNAHFVLSNLCLRREDRDKAAFHLKQVLRLDPDNAECRHFLGALQPGREPEKASSKYVADLFDGYAENFDEHLVNRLQYRAPQLLHAAVSAAVPKRAPGMLLDLGCGTGLCGPLFRDMASRLIGVDLSPMMLKKAAKLGLYDELLCEDITAAMARFAGEIDGAVAGDVLVYIGNLEDVFAAARTALKPGGWFAFTTEVSHQEDFVLNVTGRYSHSGDYLRRVAAANGFSVVDLDSATGRFQGGEPVQVHVAVFRRDAG